MTTFIMVSIWKGEQYFYKATFDEKEYPRYAYGADIVIRVLEDGSGVAVRRKVDNTGPSAYYYNSDEVLMMSLKAEVATPV